MALAAVGTARGQVVWDGGDGDWNSANWNSGLTAQEALGRMNGYDSDGREPGEVVTIDGGTVTYDPNANGDFQFRSREDNPGGTLNLAGGAVLQMNSDSDADGKWTEFDGAALNLDNATLRRTFSGASAAGGALIFGSWRSYEDQVIDVNLTNGATIENDGQVWFGAWGDNAPGLTVNMTIDGGSLDLTGGWNAFLGVGDADLVFVHGWNPDANDGAGAPKNEQYSINFVGPGSIKVSHAGILNAYEDELGDYNFTDFNLVSYQDLWNAGILQAHGFSGAKGANFNGFFTVNGESSFDDYELVSNVTDPVPVVWDGGDGSWNSAGWNGGMTAQEALGRTNGLEIGSGEIGWNVSIPAGAVTYDPNANGDFRFRAGGSLTIGPDASFTMNTASDVDGKWTEFDGDALNITGGTFSRTHSLPSESGGAMIVGSWRSYDDQKIEINVTDGGTFLNDGQLWFGAYGDNAPGLEVVMTINEGHVDLTGGYSYDVVGTGSEAGNADLILINGWNDDTNEPKGESYSINFTGPGTFTVDSAGILNPIATGSEGDPANYGDTITTLLSYEDLWDRGILQAKGASGLDGATFADFFTVSGMVGSDDYMLTSLLPPPGDLIEGDVNGDGVVDLVDFNILKANFGLAGSEIVRGDGDLNEDMTIDLVDFNILKENFGNTAPVPEPAAWALAGIALAGVALARRRR